MDLNELKYKAAQISDEKFGRENPVSAPILKLVEEIGEVLDCIKKGEDPQVEFADCFLLLVDAYRKYYGDDVDMQTLIDVSSEKLDVVAKRKWGKPNEHGVYKHIKEPVFENEELAQIENAYMLTMQAIQFDMCNKETRNKIKKLMERYLPEYQIKCDEENNPPLLMDSGHIKVDVHDPKTKKQMTIKF